MATHQNKLQTTFQQCVKTEINLNGRPELLILLFKTWQVKYGKTRANLKAKRREILLLKNVYRKVDLHSVKSWIEKLAQCGNISDKCKYENHN